MVISNLFNMVINMNEKYERDAKVFKALCDEKRLRILELLRDGEKCACVLADLTQIKQSALSYHMKILCESGIVDGVQSGKWMHYSLSEEGSSKAMLLLKELTTLNTVQTPNECYLGDIQKPIA